MLLRARPSDQAGSTRSATRATLVGPPNTEFLPLVQGDPMPRLSEGLVWWWTAHEELDGTFRPRILAADPAGGGSTEVLALGANLSPVTGGIVALQLEVAPSDVELDYLQTGLVLIDTAGTVTDLIRFTEDRDDDWFLRVLASDGDIVALVMRDAVLVLRTDGTPVAQIPIPVGSDGLDPQVWDLAVCSGRVVFTPYVAEESDTVVIYDTTTQALSTIAAPRAEPDVFCSDQRIAWTQLPEQWQTYTIAEW